MGRGDLNDGDRELMTILNWRRAKRHAKDSAPPGLPADSRAAMARLQSGPAADRWKVLSEVLGFRRTELADLRGGPGRRRWFVRDRAQEAEPGVGSLDDLLQVATYMVSTGAVRPRHVASWFRSRHLALRWQRPIDVLRLGDPVAVKRAAESTCGARLVAVP